MRAADALHRPPSATPICVLLLPRELERFILRDQAEDLLRAPDVVAVDPPRLPYGAFGRMPRAAADALAARRRGASRGACGATAASRASS